MVETKKATKTKAKTVEVEPKPVENKVDLNTVSIEELKRQIEAREQVDFLFEENGIKYYTPDQYNKFLDYIAEHGLPQDLTPIEFNQNGTAKSVEPQHQVINLEAYISNRVYVKVNPKTAKKEFHLVYDTRTVREAESGQLSIAFVNEYILQPTGKDDDPFKIERSTVSREEFLKNYVDSFGVADMLKIFKALKEFNSNDTSGTSTISL